MDVLRKEIQALGTKKRYAKGEMFFVAQEEPAGFFYIQAGDIRVFRMDEGGREVEVVRLRPGDFFGEAVVFAASSYPAYAQAARDSEVLFFEKQAVFREIEKNPATAKYFLTLLATKCLTLNERIEALGLKTVRQRLAQYLLSCCSGRQNCLVKLDIKKTELARHLGTISETLSRNLREMQEEGLIEVKGKTIRIKNCLKLKEEMAG